MNASRIGSFAALLGGLLWVVAAVLGWGEEPDAYLYLPGLALTVLALAGLGYALVATAPGWLRLVVTVATAALGYVVWLILRDALEPHLALLVGALVLLLGAALGLSRTRAPAPHSHGRGSHAAR